MRRIGHLVFSCVALLFVVSCFKEVAFRTVYVVKPLREATPDGRVPSVVSGAVAYAFDADTALWTVASYDDALAGIITSRSNPAQKLSVPVASSVPYDDSGQIRLDLAREWQMVVVVDPVDKLYAYTRQQLPVNLPLLSVSLVFQPWKQGKSYKYGNWLFFNDFYVEPSWVNCSIEVRAQASQGAEPGPIESCKVYAYAVDTTEWRIASYEHAAEGIITSKTSGVIRTSPDFPGYQVADSDVYGLEISATPVMLVAVDRSDRIYAYTKVGIDFSAPDPAFAVLFRPWQERWIAQEEGWCFVDERYAPAAEENTTDTNDE